MERFFKVFASSGNWDDAMRAIDIVYEESMVECIKDTKLMEMLTTLRLRVQGFLEFYRHRIQRWNIVAVEQEFRLTLHEDVTYPFKPDLIISEGGQAKLIDWKFTYDFYDPDVVNLLPQIPKYVGALQAMGYSVSGGYYAFIRYRSLKEETPDRVYNLHPVALNKQRIMSAFSDYVSYIESVSTMRALPLQEWSDRARRISNNMICKSCGYKFLCQAELNGSDGIMIRRQDFVPNTYGYAEEPDA
jgi:hypothetical protein